MIDNHNILQISIIQEEWNRLQIVDAMKWITLNKKKPENLTLFKNFVKNHSQIMKKKE
jgi:hypothetical protein